MKTIKKIAALRKQLNEWRMAGDVIAFVPTMGNLHAGHMQLVAEAKAQADRVVVSIFVNPSQFGVGEDFSSYPRTEEEDNRQLAALSVDVVFLPDVSEIYPNVSVTTVSVSGVSESYCGKKRPGHFDGVATVVSKLFNIVQPHKAFFGEKDFQQLAVIRAMVDDLNFAIEIVAVAIVREESGLAMSSRNGYLTVQQREQAAHLYRLLCSAKKDILLGKNTLPEIEIQSLKQLQSLGFDPEYFSVCRQSDLMPVTAEDKALIILLAAKLGNTRLIDNIQIQR